MKGKILGAGAISGEDGLRYYYDENELKNAKEGQKLENCEVDFDIKDGKAVGVYITKSSGFNTEFGKNVSASFEKVNLPSFDTKHIFWDLNEAKSKLIKVNMHSVKFWLLLVCFVNLFSFFGATTPHIPQSISWVFSFIFIAILLWINFSLSVLSQSYRIFKFQILIVVFLLVASWFVVKAYESYIYSLGANVPYVKISFAVLLCLASLFSLFKWFQTLSQITEQKAYLWSLYAYVGLIILGFIVAYFDSSTFLKAVDAIKDFSIFAYLAFMALFIWATLRFRNIKALV